MNVIPGPELRPTKDKTMNASRTRTTARYGKTGGMVLTVALAALIGCLSSVSARADNDRGRNVQHERAKPNRHPPHRSVSHSYGYAAPGYVYAPPPVYYAPRYRYY